MTGMKLSDVGFNTVAAQRYREGVKQAGISAHARTEKAMRGFRMGSAAGFHSRSRKAASAMIAKIPFPLAQHIAQCFKPVSDDPFWSCRQAGPYQAQG